MCIYIYIYTHTEHIVMYRIVVLLSTVLVLAESFKCNIEEHISHQYPYTHHGEAISCLLVCIAYDKNNISLRENA